MMLRSRDEKVKRLELLADGILSGEKYLVEENKALLEEIQMLQARPDGNPELTQYAVENSRLLEQLQL
jgi:kinesin family protein 15